MAKLTAKQQTFVAEYLVDLNATQAAIRAGYAEKSAYSQGQRLLKNDEVQAAIQKAQEERAQRLEITGDDVIRRLAEIGFGDLRKCFDAQGRLLAPEAMPDEVAPLLAGIDVVTSEKGEGEVEHVAKIRTRDTVKALELLGKHFGKFEKDNTQKQPVLHIDRKDEGA